MKRQRNRKQAGWLMATARYIVADVQQAVDFYTGLPGFNLVQRFGDAMAIVQSGDLRLWLAGPRSSAAKPMPDGAKPQPGGWNRIVVTVEDVDDAVSALKVAGAGFRNEVISGPGGRQVLVEDPSGNVIELFEPRG
jgi:catechol 2,3-dioxygenase-like lactoylglutathione lyase family enzyme